ncbi:MAG: UDP-N-acetylmuramoyl-L-alanine--D-glutamate ligase [Elusimicrobiaceae bacterium]|jgi:UDP-N-acetylmuramoylalanine--D-glutamate ligase|nr:UDP-N-acetylmuramoyl-L-alanine--D-glutamate ligase [Elusimicrobiaceae bacterium]MBT3955610.1 UDP-N-acetylmuramoyl-L-alanine--D-glutamate ligase [Elusimicrobiaceae bacterium]MBT4008724.1 UDP-N-acetylmuramoyl-L-alanine--D-glutamate ligase [Elusimicrobiaceae bacterium]MBT4402765.1 UDP-N-acetylmuramoyl-L-alanine--D-glutamate ligase [Elusimicrobiaceae bacterium]MBT4439600.1 UDP-N-acetylmuramoyl-L-alanine--D-glutamate ligase [Elusimicrobiaceae bacterium]
MFNPKKFKSKKACVLGAGKSGQAVFELLKQKKFNVVLKNTEDDVLGYDFYIKSPGISFNNAVIKKIVAQKKPIFSELEVGLAFAPNGINIIAITGTNGKTTTTELTSKIFKQHIKDKKLKNSVFTCGNIGFPVSSFATKIKKGDFLVLELSSYQLEDSTYFKPTVSALLNITNDHVFHHGSFSKYIKAKCKIFGNQNKSDFLIINQRDVLVKKLTARAKPKILHFAMPKKLTPPKIKGGHNLQNAMASYQMANAMGISISSIQKAFDNFKGVEHRIEEFAKINDITFINDSKATNVDSTITALKTFCKKENKNIFLILGGKDKGDSYKPLKKYIDASIKKVLVIGNAEKEIVRDLKITNKLVLSKTMEEAVNFAFKTAKKGDIVLLSPACSSFDCYKNFEIRGKDFKQLVKKLSS